MAESKIQASQELKYSTPSYTVGAHTSIRRFSISRTGRVVSVEVYFDATSNLANNEAIINVPNGGLPKPTSYYATAYVHGIGTADGQVSIEAGLPDAVKAWGAIPQGSYYYAQFMYITSD